MTKTKVRQYDNPEDFLSELVDRESTRRQPLHLAHGGFEDPSGIYPYLKPR